MLSMLWMCVIDIDADTSTTVKYAGIVTYGAVRYGTRTEKYVFARFRTVPYRAVSYRTVPYRNVAPIKVARSQP